MNESNKYWIRKFENSNNNSEMKQITEYHLFLMPISTLSFACTKNGIILAFK